MQVDVQESAAPVRGLSSADAREWRCQDGPNELPRDQRRGLPRIAYAGPGDGPLIWTDSLIASGNGLARAACTMARTAIDRMGKSLGRVEAASAPRSGIAD